MEKIIKIFFIFSMFVVNIIYVSEPSIKKYFERGIVIEVSTVSLDNIQSPAFTFSRRGPDELLVFITAYIPSSETFFQKLI